MGSLHGTDNISLMFSAFSRDSGLETKQQVEMEWMLRRGRYVTYEDWTETD